MADVGTQVSATLDALTKEFDVIAHNLANVSTVGYKRRCNVFSKALEAQSGAGGEEGGQDESSEGVFDFSQGHLMQTDRTLDFALYGKGFFVIETPDGPLYTRHGVFETNQNGQIVDLSGRIVAGTAGPLVVPSDVGLSQISVASDGRISAAGAAIGQFRVVEFGDKKDQLVPAGENCFQVSNDVVPADAEEPVVKQGYREASNVKLVEEMVNMIMVSRLYEANVKLVNVKKDTTSSAISVAMG
jgi:flagellar basal body rod protein FlgG